MKSILTILFIEKMTGTILRPTNKKAIQCPLCDKWFCLAGYNGHIRWYHGGYEKERKRKLFNRLIAIRRADKITQRELVANTAIVGAGSKATTAEIDMEEEMIEYWERN